MKGAKAKPRSPSPKRRERPKTVAAYLAAVPQPARTTLQKVRTAIRSAVPADTKEVLSYGIPAFRRNGVLVWYAAFSKHCSFFPTAAVIEAFRNDLKSYTISKGTIQFPIDKPLPAVLVKKMVKARLAQLSTRKRP